jgi:molecular chaperone DnaK (HSP70)
MILFKIKADAEANRGRYSSRITVPAYFNDIKDKQQKMQEKLRT